MNRFIPTSVFILVLLLSAFRTNAQVSKVYNNVEAFTHTFSLEQGKIQINWPPLVGRGQFTGQITLLPKGRNRRQIQKNLKVLQTYTLHWGSQQLVVKEGMHRPLWVSDKEESTRQLGLWNAQGKLITYKDISIINPSSPPPPQPTYLVSTGKIPLAGTFDGNLDNTRVLIGNQEAILLAESNHFLLIQLPELPAQRSTVQIFDETEKTSFEVPVLKLNMQASDLQLKRGQKAQLVVSVEGLRDLETPIEMTLDNQSPEVLDISGGNRQSILIDPSLAKNGIYRKNFALSGRQTGAFSVRVQIPPYLSSRPEKALCSCWLAGHWRLLPPMTCQALEGSCEIAPKQAQADRLPPKTSVSIDMPIKVDAIPTLIPIFPGPGSGSVIIWAEERHLNSDMWVRIPMIHSGPERRPSLMWEPPLGSEGFHLIRLHYLSEGQPPQQISRIMRLDLSPDFTVNGYTATISSGQIRREEKAAEDAEEDLRQARERLNKLEDNQRDTWEDKITHEDKAKALAAIDRSLDRLPATIGDSLKRIVDSLDQLKKALGSEVDTAALQAMVKQAQDRLQDCQDHLLALQKQKNQIQQAQVQNKAKTDQLLEELHQLMTDHGITGGYGYHDDGRYWYGYVGSGDADGEVIYSTEFNEIAKNLRGLKKDFLANKAALKKLDDDIRRAEQDCAELTDQLAAAKQALANGQQHQSLAVAAREKCRQIHSLLQSLQEWCRNQSGNCPFEDLLTSLLERCPLQPEHLERFLNDFDRLLKQKKSLETDHTEAAEAAMKKLKDTHHEVTELEDQISALEDKRWKHLQEAERLRRQRARELEAERRRRAQRARAKQEAEQAPPQAKPILDDPVDPSDDQLKWGAKLAVRALYPEYLVSKGPCDCITKALALSNNTNSIVTDLIGRIGVGVAFAPLEAFPGVKLGGRLAIGALKALASVWIGGEKLSDELIKNLFNAIGGELFPKLLGNDFTGNRLNDLAGKGLEEILEAEGIRTVTWSGSTHLAECGPVKGSSTLLVNPNTGWVVISIKIDDCPLIVIKYQINDDGIAISDPIVQEIAR